MANIDQYTTELKNNYKQIKLFKKEVMNERIQKHRRIFSLH